jgi:hydrogenase nickel incorporation protein HypA/HybF
VHEYSIVRSLLDRVNAEARARRAHRVRRLWIRVGELAGVDAGLLRAAYDLCRDGTVCADAPIEIQVVGAQWTCAACDRGVGPTGPRRCGTCGGPARLTAGDDLRLERIEMEVADV